MVYINSYGQICCDNYLAHHGILGQKYGVRNGPPYPLDAKSHSASERKAGWRKSLNSSGRSNIRYGAQTRTKAQVDNSLKDKLAKKVQDKAPLKSYLINTADLAIRTNIRFAVAVQSKRLIDYGRSKVKQVLEDKRVSKLEVDAKTGFHLKKKDMTPEEDMKHINPQFKNFDTNTKNNCMLCTTAYELRRRGYDVQAGTSTRGYQNKEVTEWFPKAKLESAYSVNRTDKKQLSKEATKVGFGIGGKEKYRKLSESLLKHGDGARGNLMISWNWTGGGHSVVWENQNGRVILRDCQSGKKYTGEGQISKLLSKTFDATYARTDNVDFDKKKVKELVR